MLHSIYGLDAREGEREKIADSLRTIYLYLYNINFVQITTYIKQTINTVCVLPACNVTANGNFFERELKKGGLTTIKTAHDF